MAGGALGGRWAHSSHGIFILLFEVDELMDLIQRDLLSVTAHLFKSVWCSSAEKNEAQVDMLSDCVLKNRSQMQCHACSVLPLCIFSFHLSFSSFLIQIDSSQNVRSANDVWLYFLFDDFTIQEHPPDVCSVWVDQFSPLFDHHGDSSRDLFCSRKALSPHALQICNKLRQHLKVMSLHV